MSEPAVTYWVDGQVVVGTFCDQAGGVLWVEQADRRWSGHDHYWLGNDGTVRCDDHHDYDTPGWPTVGADLPSDRVVLDGVMLPDEVWEQVRPW